MKIIRLARWRSKDKRGRGRAASNTREKEEKQEAPGVSGNKGISIWPLTFSCFLGTWEQRKIKLGTREQKHILGNREHQNRRNTFRELGNVTQGKYLPSLGRPLGYPPSCRSRPELLRSFSPTFLSLKYPWGDPVRGTLNNFKAGLTKEEHE